MNTEVWQKLLMLESQELVKNLFYKIHKQKINSRRAKEIISSAKQAREYFRNTNSSSFSVRPLLAFYGVASLSKSLTLLLKNNGGEDNLTASHGLTTEDWSNELYGDLSKSLKSIGNLKIKTTSGLFTDFINHTENRMSFHVNSSGVDWRLYYHKPSKGKTLTFSQIISRLPDLFSDFKQISDKQLYSSVQKMGLNEKEGFYCEVHNFNFEKIENWFLENKYDVIKSEKFTELKSTLDNFNNNKPQFIHTYVNKQFGSIPSLYISKPFENNLCYSQLGLTFIASYYLGMLVRYYPTQWTQLVSSSAGDKYWPTINRLQGYIEQAFPELVIELINDILEVGI